MNSTGRPSRIAPKMASTRGGKVEGCVAFFTADLGARVAETRATGASGTASASLGTLVFAGALVAGLALGSAASAFLGAAFFAGAGLALMAGFSTSGVVSVGFLRGVLVTAMGLWLLAHHGLSAVSCQLSAISSRRSTPAVGVHLVIEGAEPGLVDMGVDLATWWVAEQAPGEPAAR